MVRYIVCSEEPEFSPYIPLGARESLGLLRCGSGGWCSRRQLSDPPGPPKSGEALSAPDLCGTVPAASNKKNAFASFAASVPPLQQPLRES